ncbi:MAG: hypothetical protein E6Q97_12080 [Desulfurellales bacterium]|nr:MAG: hypothetical protein E6Q97_12080 [Desulfurellales bacterium]
MTKKDIQKAIKCTGSQRAAARSLGLPESTLRSRLKRQEKLTVQSQGTQTLDEVLESAGVDQQVWEPVQVNLDGKTGKLRATLKRKKTELIPDLKALAEVKPRKWKKPAGRDPGMMLEIDIPDWHAGKLCWGDETGQNYDLDIAAQVYENAVEDLLNRSAGQRISKILIPTGGDMLHSNDFSSQTVKGTRVESVDDRFSKVFQTACESIVRGIDMCRQVAPVEFVWIMGNHDEHSSWYMSQVIKARYRNDRFVSVDDGPSSRKYVKFGCSLIGLTHGDKERIDSLPLLMATEQSQWWAECPTREFHLGHWHKKKQVKYVALDELNGVRVRVLSSLSATDSWHYREGYTGNRREAQALLWCPQEGAVAEYLVKVRE